MSRKSFTAEFKSKVAIEALKGHKTTNEIASEFGIHTIQVNNRQIGKLQVEVDWLKKKDWASRLTLQEKRSMIEPEHPKISIARQCELLCLPRSSYYHAEPKREESTENLDLIRLIDEEYTRRPFYGSRKIRDYLRRQGYRVNRKRVQRLMQKMGLVSVATKPNTSKRCPQHKVYPYLLRGLDITRPNQVWCTDITYIRLSGDLPISLR